MPFGEEFQVGPQIPRNPGPASVGTMIPGGAGEEQSFGDFFGSAGAPAPASNEPSFGAMMNGEAPEPPPMPERTTSARPPQPTEPRNYEENAAATKEQADRLVDEMRGTLKGKEAKEAEKHETDGEFQSLIDQVDFELGPKPAGEEQFVEDENIEGDGYKVARGKVFPRADSQGLGPMDSVKQSWARLKAGLGRNNKEVVNAIRSVWGNENVQTKDGEIYFRPNGKGKFRRFDPKAFEFMSDIFLDMAGPMIEGVVSAGTEAVGRMATTAGTAALSGTPAAPLAPAAAAGGNVLSATAGAAAGTLAREGAIQAVDAVSDQKMRDEEISLLGETAWNAGFNLGAMGISSAGKNVVKPIFQKFIQDMPMNRIKALAGVRQEFDNFVKALPGFENMGIREGGKKIFDAIDAYGNRLESAVSMVKTKAVELAESQGRKGFSTENLLNKLRDVLENNRVRFDPETGQAFIQAREKEEAGALTHEAWKKHQEMLPPDVRGIGTPEPLTEAEKQSAKAQTMMAFGEFGGERNLQRYVDQYNALLGASKTPDGGIPVDTLQDFIDGYSKRAEYSKVEQQTKREMSVARELRNAAATDRHSAYELLFKGSGLPEEEMYRSAYENFSKNIDDIVHFRSLFNQQESTHAFAKSLVQPENIERLAKLKGLLGEGSREFDAFRGEWVAELVNSSVRKSSGVLDANFLLEQMGSVGKDVLNAMLSKEEQAAIRKMAVMASKIPYADLLAPGDKAGLESMLALLPIKQFETSRARSIWNIIGNSKIAADYLLEDGWMNLAKNAPTKEMQASYLGARKFMSDMVKRMKTAKITRVNPKTKARTVVEIYVPVGRQAAGQAAIQSLKNAGSALPDDLPDSGDVGDGV